MFNTIAPLTLKCRHSIGPLRAGHGQPDFGVLTDRQHRPDRPASLSDLIKAVFSRAFGVGIEGGERGGLEGEVKRPRSFSYATRPFTKYCRWIMDKLHDVARERKCHSRSYPGEIAVKYAFKMASRYPCRRQRALWSRLVSYQVNIDGGGGLGFLAAAFSPSAFKERIFPHNDGGNNNAAAAAAAAERTSHRIEPRPPPLCH